MSPVDALIGHFDRGLRTLCNVHGATSASPAQAVREASLDEATRAHSAALMRVNHVGEVCAQALYQGQALTAREPGNRAALEQAAREEQDHLVWSALRVEELGGRLSLLNPLWYAGALAIGAGAGLLGDRWSLAFLAETEKQVEEHLEGHLAQLAPEDSRTRVLIERMRADEAQHRETALALGAAELPDPAKRLMRAAAKLMTSVAYRV